MRTLTLCLALSLTVSGLAVAQDRSTPEATVQTFLSAFAKGDLKQAAECVKGAKLTDEMMTELSGQIRKDPASFTLTDAKTSKNGDTASVTGNVTVKSGRSEQTQTMPTETNLTLTNGAWLIVPDASKMKNAVKPDIVNYLAYVLTDTEVFTRARGAAKQTVCLSNVKQVSLGMMMFLQDHDEKYKVKPESYKKSIMPYIKNEGVFRCPDDKGAGASYSFNANLAGKSMAGVKFPAETVMIYEGKNGKLDFRHNGRATVGFADGHAKLIDAAGAKKLRWKP